MFEGMHTIWNFVQVELDFRSRLAAGLELLLCPPGN